MSIAQFSQADLLSLTSIVVAIVIGLITWILSWVIFRTQSTRKKLSYYMRMTPIITHEFSKGKGKLEIKYNGEEIDQLVLLEIDIKNTGNVVVESPPIKISNQGGVYLIPGYFEDVPPGYDDLWGIERIDGEDSFIVLGHINPGQIAKVRFVMDNMPNKYPEVSCPMPGLQFSISRVEEFKPMLSVVFRIVFENIIGGSIFRR